LLRSKSFFAVASFCVGRRAIGDQTAMTLFDASQTCCFLIDASAQSLSFICGFA
jgi:hypothetical protein